MSATTTPTAHPDSRPTPPWRVVTNHELGDLWLGTKGLTVLFSFTVVLSVFSYLASADAGLNLLDARESVSVIAQTAIALGALAALVVSADSISGERERGTLEALLVTPVGKRQLVIGKLIASSTIWVAAVIVAVPFIVMLARGPDVVADAVAVLVIAGGLVAMALTSMGMAISAVANSNRVSLAASIMTMLILAAPSQLPSVTSKGVLGSILIRLNPVSAGLKFASEVLTSQKTWSSEWTLLLSPVIASVVLTIVAISLAGRVSLGGSR